MCVSIGTTIDSMTSRLTNITENGSTMLLFPYRKDLFFISTSPYYVDSVCVCVCVFIYFHIIAQSGPVILVILCHLH